MRHVLYKTGDKDAPNAIKDRNGDVALDCCKVCGLSECQLDEQPECPGKPDKPTEEGTDMEAIKIGTVKLDDKDFTLRFSHHDTPLTEEQAANVKRALYRAGRYTFPVPGVPHEKWTEDDWIRYIDNHGGWLATRLDGL